MTEEPNFDEQPIFDDLLAEFLAAGYSEPIPTQPTRDDQSAPAGELVTADRS